MITIDGPVAAGKTTVARRLAIELGYTLLDTGAIYRCLTLYALEHQVDWSDEAGLALLAAEMPIDFGGGAGGDRVRLNGEEVTAAIRSPDVSQGASIVSAWPAVRQALLALQRRLGQASPGLIAEGRDTGTVVFPHAEVKFFLTAAAEVRAQRRQRELAAQRLGTTLEQVLAELNQRDDRDTRRALAPLVQAADAIFIDTTEMTVEAVLDRIRRQLTVAG